VANIPIQFTEGTKQQGQKFTVAQSPMATKFSAWPPNHHYPLAHVANEYKHFVQFTIFISIAL
jgi:hypothetical protein